MSDLFVFDTNVLVSASFIPESASRKALNIAIELGDLIISNETMNEFTEVLFRKKFDKYFLENSERWSIIDKIGIHTRSFNTETPILACRDPKDNKFLELAVTANAACIVSGDKDLLVLNPFRGIPILKATDFIEKFTI